MNGIDFIADTNFLINVYEGNKIVEPFLDYNFATSYISEIELLGVFSINKIQRKELRELLNECTIIAVSYTHLDVYKRQMQVRENRFLNKDVD